MAQRGDPSLGKEVNYRTAVGGIELIDQLYIADELRHLAVTLQERHVTPTQTDVKLGGIALNALYKQPQLTITTSSTTSPDRRTAELLVSHKGAPDQIRFSLLHDHTAWLENHHLSPTELLTTTTSHFDFLETLRAMEFVEQEYADPLISQAMIERITTRRTTLDDHDIVALLMQFGEKHARSKRITQSFRRSIPTIDVNTGFASCRNIEFTHTQINSLTIHRLAISALYPVGKNTDVEKTYEYIVSRRKDGMISRAGAYVQLSTTDGISESQLHNFVKNDETSLVDVFHQGNEDLFDITLPKVP